MKVINKIVNYLILITIGNRVLEETREQIKIKNKKIYFYDYLSRNDKNKYIMLKI